MTKHLELFRRLSEEFRTPELKVRDGKGPGKPKFFFITARTLMNRLDDVLGCENWWDEYVPSEKSVLCRLTIRLPDGQILTKADAGGYAGLADQGDDDKSGYSDAFKRAAVKFGIARHVYGDGVADLRGPFPVGESTAAVGSGHALVVPPKPLAMVSQAFSGKGLYAWAMATSASLGIDMVAKIKEWSIGKNLPADLTTWDIGDVTDCQAAMAKMLDERGHLQIPADVREKMPKVRDERPTSEPGPLHIDGRDRFKQVKRDIQQTARRLYVAAFRKEIPTEAEVMEYIKVRCKEHGIVPPDTIRNLTSSEHLNSIFKALQEDEREMGIF